MSYKKVKKRKSLVFRIFRVFFFLIITSFLIVGGLIFYALKIEPSLLKVNQLKVSYDPSVGAITTEKGTSNSFDLKVVQFSDLEMSEDYDASNLPKILEKINSQNPDIVVFTGDLFSNYAQYAPTDQVLDFLTSINSKYGKFAVYGNNDYGGGAVRHYESLMEDSDFTLLRNSSSTITTEEGSKVFIGGLDESSFGNPNAEKTLAGLDNSYDYSLVLVHEPDLADSLNDYSIGQILSGHTHGGQVNIPLVSIPKIEALGYKGTYIQGIYSLSGQHSNSLYVNNGLGTSRLSVRFMAPPEVAVFNISI